MPTAHLLRDDVPGHIAPGRLYRLDAPIEGHDHVVIVHQPADVHRNLREETLILPGNQYGLTAPNVRLPGSQVGLHDDAGALWAAGGFVHGEAYNVVIPQHDPTDEPTVSVTLSATVEVQEGTA